MGQSGAGTASGSRPTASEYVVASGSTGGQLIAVAATSSPGTIIHTVPADMKLGYQLVKVFGCNIDTVNRTVTLQPGGTATKDAIVRTMGAKRGMVELTPSSGLKMARGAVLRAFASSANVINAYCAVGEPDKGP